MQRTLIAFIAACAFAASLVKAEAGSPQWSAQELATFADVIVAGRVAAITTSWDDEVAAIYTYVEFDVDEVVQGEIESTRLVVKQLGGEVGDTALRVPHQAVFAIGEEVLLYLERRPRDGSLYTAALWQGKWPIVRGATGERLVVPPVAPGDGWGALATGSADPAFGVDPFSLLGPFRYSFPPPVDSQANGQPGLPGGGTAEILNAMARWNNVGSGFFYTAGSNSSAPRCAGQFLGNRRVTITFMDPCGEMSNTGGTLAIGGSYFSPADAGSSNGQRFSTALEGFVVTNDSTAALSLLTQRGCFEDVQTHELGHVLGLGHSTDPGAIMFPSLDRTCVNGAHQLGADDRAGLFSIYGPRGAAPTTAPRASPRNVRVSVNGRASVTVSADAEAELSASSPSGYRADFRAGHQEGGPLVASAVTASPTLTITIPAGVSGPFNVVVSAVNTVGSGPPSPRVDFTIPAALGPGCSAPPPPVSNVAATVAGTLARVIWQASPGATSYRVQVGSSPGGADLLAPIDVGNTTVAQGEVSPGFRGWVRITAVNACGIGAGVDVFLQP